MDIFEIEGNRFGSRSHFHQYLSDKYEDISNGNLYLCAGITELDFADFMREIGRKGWEQTESYGDIVLIECEYGSRVAKSYLSFDEETGLFFLYTDQRKSEEIDNSILPLLRDSEGVHYLYVGPRIIKSLCEKIAEEWESSKVTTFVARRTPGTGIEAKRRPSTNRTINYYGEDGLRSLREMESEYGVLPHTVEIHIPSELRFRVNKEGIFTLKQGKMISLFKYMNSCIEQTMAMKREYDTTDFEILKVRNEYEIPDSKPATIQPKRTLSASDIKDIRDNLETSQYTALDVFFDSINSTLTAKVFDSEENAFFNIEIDPTQIKIFPREESRISVFIRFFEFIQSEVDDRATAKAETKFEVFGD